MCKHTTLTQVRARKIMGRNMFGVKEAVKHFSVSPSTQELAYLADIPFSEETLSACRYSHVLIAIFPLSIFDIRNKVDPTLFDNPHAGSDTYHDSWGSEEAFATDCGKITWHLVRKTPVPNSTEKTWQQQQLLLGMNEKTSSARVVVYTMLGHFLSSGDRRERLFDRTPYVRCSDILAQGRHVVVGGFEGPTSGVAISNYSDNDPLCTLGVASVRTF